MRRVSLSLSVPVTLLLEGRKKERAGEGKARTVFLGFAWKVAPSPRINTAQTSQTAWECIEEACCLEEACCCVLEDRKLRRRTCTASGSGAEHANNTTGPVGVPRYG